MEKDKRIMNYLNSWVTLVETRMQSEAPYFHIKVPDYVFAVAITVEGMVALVKQYRVAQDKVTLELPSGLIDKGQTAEETLVQELQEEVGITAFEKVIELPNVSLDTGRLQNTCIPFIVTGAKIDSRLKTEKGIDSVLVTQTELIRLAVTGEIDHLGHVALVLLAKELGFIKRGS
jgi:ADP-ribose pyrophosphatase